MSDSYERPLWRVLREHHCRQIPDHNEVAGGEASPGTWVPIAPDEARELERIVFVWLRRRLESPSTTEAIRRFVSEEAAPPGALASALAAVRRDLEGWS